MFSGTSAGTIGLEEELLLVHRGSWSPATAAAVLDYVDDPRIKQELPACQVEIATSVHEDPYVAVAELHHCRTVLAATCPPDLAVVATPVHPLVDGPVELSGTARAAGLDDRYREVIQRQLVSSLQVHLAFGDADCTLAVYNALRDLLPELTALAAAAPYVGGRDSGLCSVRPVIAAQLPRQGVPPIIGSWEQYAADLEWAVQGRAVDDPSEWWWELRPHGRFGTLELRVLDVQARTEQTSALVRFVHALGAMLAQLHHRGSLPEPAPSWRIAENRWSALRDGVHGELLDLRHGTARPTRRRLHELVDAAEAYAPGGLEDVRAMIEIPAVDQLRSLGPRRMLPWLAEVFAE